MHVLAYYMADTQLMKKKIYKPRFSCSFSNKRPGHLFLVNSCNTIFTFRLCARTRDLHVKHVRKALAFEV